MCTHVALFERINTDHKWAAALGLCLEKKEKLVLALSRQRINDATYSLCIVVPVNSHARGVYISSYMSSSSSNSPSSSAVASWYCWYSETKSFMLDSASVNSISSIPSPVYQWRKAFLLNMAVNCSPTLLSICSSTSLVDILPLNMAEAVRYLPCLGSEAHIMFLASNICWVSSGTVRALHCWDPLEVSGANPVMKK